VSKPRVYKFEGKKGVTVDGHTMLIDDVVRDLNKLVAFERARGELIDRAEKAEAKLRRIEQVAIHTAQGNCIIPSSLILGGES